MKPNWGKFNFGGIGIEVFVFMMGTGVNWFDKKTINKKRREIDLATMYELNSREATNFVCIQNLIFHTCARDMIYVFFNG